MYRLPIPILILGVCLLPAQTGKQDLATVQTVYLLQMGFGLDQYLANHLASAGVFTVVTDHKQADAVFTDAIGTALETKLVEMAEASKPEPTDEEKEKDKGKDRDKAKIEAYRLPASQFGRGKGNVFLVDLKSRRVLWSIYSRPKQYVPDELDKLAGTIVERLKKDRFGK